MRLLLWLLALALLGAAGFGAYSWVTGKVDVGSVQKTEETVDAGRADAGIQSGADAAETVKDAGDREAEVEATTRENTKEIRDAEGADAPVAKPVRDAGLVALCRRRAYRDNPRYADRCRGLRVGAANR